MVNMSAPHLCQKHWTSTHHTPTNAMQLGDVFSFCAVKIRYSPSNGGLVLFYSLLCHHFFQMSLWVQVELYAPCTLGSSYEKIGPSLVLTGRAKRWILLSSSTTTHQWSISRLVSIQVRATNKRHHVLNLRPWWRIKDEWLRGAVQQRRGRGQSSRYRTCQ